MNDESASVGAPTHSQPNQIEHYLSRASREKDSDNYAQNKTTFFTLPFSRIRIVAKAKRKQNYRREAIANAQIKVQRHHESAK